MVLETSEKPPIGQPELSEDSGIDAKEEEKPEEVPLELSLELQKQLTDLRKAKEHSADVDSLLPWLTNGNPGFTSTLTEVRDFLINENSEDPASKTEIELIDKIIELREALPSILGQFNIEAAKLSGPEYTKIQDRKEAVIKGLADPVINGHLTTEELSSMVSGGVLLAPREEIEKMVASYEAALCIDLKNGKVYISTEALKDSYRTKAGQEIGPIDLRHSLNHEVSHEVVARVFSADDPVYKKADEIIETAKSQAELQPLHIRTLLTGLPALDQKAEEHFQLKFKDDARLTDADFKSAYKEKFIADEKRRIAVEIVTEYTALYLQSDGSFEGFFLKCFEMMSENGKNSFDIQIKTINEYYKAEGEEKQRIFEEMKQADPEFSRLAETYVLFYKELRQAITEREDDLSEEELEDDDMMYELFPDGLVAEPAPAVAEEQKSIAGSNNSPQSKKSETRNAVFSFFKAFAEEVKLDAPIIEK